MGLVIKLDKNEMRRGAVSWYLGTHIFVYKCAQRQIAEGSVINVSAARTSDPSSMQVTEFD